jgi:hypothetical protein
VYNLACHFEEKTDTEVFENRYLRKHLDQRQWEKNEDIYIMRNCREK